MNALTSHWLLEEGLVFLNHGSFGACPKPVLQYQNELRDLMERDPVRFFGHEAPLLMENARQRLATFLNADAEELVFVPNATTGLNAAIGSLRMEHGDEVLITDHAYNATRNIAAEVCTRNGGVLAVARVPFPCAAPEVVVESVTAHLTRRTRYAVLDHVTSATGLIFPLERLIALLHARDIFVIVDGAHAPGMLPLDLNRLGADLYAGNCHKWLCAPKGAGFLHVPRQHQGWVRPAVTSHGANESGTDGETRFRLAFDWTGTDDPTAALAVPAAIDFMGSLLSGGWSQVRSHNRDLALEARNLLRAALQVEAGGPDEMIGSLAALPLPDSERLPQAAAVSAFVPDPLQMLLYERYRIQVPITTCPAHPRMLRVSAAAYNDRSDYERLAAALQEILQQ